MKKIIICILAIFVLNYSSYSEESVKTGLKNKVERKYFIFYFNEDKEKLNEVFDIFEENYEKISSVFKVQLIEKVNVEIFPNLNDYQMNSFGVRSEEWLVGNHDEKDNVIKMVSPNKPGIRHNYDSIMKVAVHEFVHYIVYHAAADSNIPIWLNEGIAVYYAEQIDGNIRQILKKLITKKEIPQTTELKDYEGFMKWNGYQFSYFIVEFIVKEYGEEGLIKFLKEPVFEKAFSVSEKEFNKKLQEYLVKKYK